MQEEYKNVISNYIKVIKAIDMKDATEHTYRAPLESLIKSVKFPTKKITPIHEGKANNLDIDGTPDFYIYEDYESSLKTLVGFIECKKHDYDLKTLIKSHQIQKYSKTSENIIITNYREFILLQNGKVEANVALLDKNFTELVNENKFLDLVNLLASFYNYEYQYIKTTKSLVNALASQSFYYSVALREFILNKRNEQDAFYKQFNALFGDYQESIQYHYELADFCDIYAQSLVYGLLLSRLDNPDSLFSEESRNYLDKIPDSYSLLCEFLERGYSIRNIPASIKMALTNIGKNINLIDIPSIQKEFDKTNKGKSNIAVYLYEDFLKQYDDLRKTEKRKEGGVYYTPKEAADFITRGVNDIIKSSFGLKDGYMSKNVKILDFACGTGTFINSIFDIIAKDNMDDLEKMTLKEKVTKDIYGFEILFTPYIIAHTILTKYLKDKGIGLYKDERLGIYLTNTLDISQHAISNYLPNLKDEQEKSQNIKDNESILAIVGNPPYFNGKSQSEKGVIDEEIKKYKKDLNEKNIRPLGDMYIKFIRFAEWKIEKAGFGIVGIITNNSFLDGITHRQMRKHLLETFDEIYIVNLHGNNRKGELDKNIFDIMVGVNITFLVKHKEPLEHKKVFYYSTLDNGINRREEKLEFLENGKLSEITWQELNPSETKNYWFINKDLEHTDSYDSFWKVTDIFEKYNTGIGTENDSICIKYSLNELSILKSDWKNLKKDEIIIKYKITEKSDWTFKNAKKDIIENYNPHTISYRTFDYRVTSLSKTSKRFLGRPRYDIMQHFDNRDNLGLVFKRQFLSDSFNHCFIANKPLESCILSGGSGRAYVAPLYLYTQNASLFESDKIPNWTSKFISEYIASLSFTPTPEQIMAYIYAVLHSQAYREKYITFLKTDFPAVPMTKDFAIFDKFASLGQKLINLHLMNEIPDDKDIKISLGGVTNNFVIKNITPPTKNEQKLTLTTADGQIISFDNVSKDIYDFEIGSYKPIDKWLKYRIKDNVLLNVVEDITHIKNMIIVIKNSINIMSEIETLHEEYLTNI